MIYLGYLLLDLWVFFVLYVACMNIIRAHDEGILNPILWVLCLPIVAIGWVIDVLHNWTLFFVVYAELPREFTFTSRLKRHIDRLSWRGRLSRFICAKILSPFDYTKNHCD